MLSKEGVFIFKKILVILITTFLLSMPFRVHAAHPEFQKIIFNKNSISDLIEDMPQSKIDKAYENVKRKVFGWSVAKITSDETVSYIGQTVFSRANNTSNELVFAHTYEVEDTCETSVSVTGDISIEVSGKVKSVNAGLDASVRKEIGEKSRKSIVETTKTTLIIAPRTKLSVVLKGKARLNNGVAYYHFLGIRFRKGTWEYIDIITEYYDYYEENL